MNDLTLFESPQFGRAKIAPTETLEQLTSGMITVNQARKNFGLDLIKEPSADCKSIMQCNRSVNNSTKKGGNPHGKEP